MKFFPPATIDGETVKARRLGPDSGPLPGKERWELRDAEGTTLLCHCALPNGTPDSEGLRHLGIHT